VKRSKFSLSHYKLLTCKMGQLVPVTWFEALPGDTIQHATSALIRCAPLVSPVMHPVHVRFHHWFVPNRIIWQAIDDEGWEGYITGGADGSNTDVHPYIDFSTEPAVGSLADYLGVPTEVSDADLRVNALPFRAYQTIWNEFYRDEDLNTKANVANVAGADAFTSTELQFISWEKDYLTSSRPWVLKGPSVTLPLGTHAPVGEFNAGGMQLLEMAASGSISQLQRIGGGNTTTGDDLMADLSQATSVDINTVRQAFALQRFEEARARYGSRYTEYLRYLGVRSSDARLQRPEYLGGGRQTIQFSEVLQTGGTSAGAQTGVGQMAGHGISAMRTNRYRRFFEEHGIVMTLMSVRPRTMYSQRVKRGFLRGMTNGMGGIAGNKTDYWQRELQHIGQQGVCGLEADVRLDGNVVFGYQDRYDEYRREESSVAGLFRSSLDTWHFSREFGSDPALNSTFTQCVPATRVFADTSADNLYVMANHSIQARRLVAGEGSSMTF